MPINAFAILEVLYSVFNVSLKAAPLESETVGIKIKNDQKTDL